MCNIVAVCDGTDEGFLTVLYKYYYEKLRPVRVVGAGAQLSLDEETAEIATNRDEARRAMNGMKAKFSPENYERVTLAMMNADPERFTPIFNYCVAVFRHGNAADGWTQVDYIIKVHHYARESGHELQLLRGFTRFTDTAGGTLYACIEPKNDVLAPLADFFSDRLNGERWIIHDMKRRKAALFNGRSLAFSDAPAFEQKVEEAGGQDYYKRLWAAFYGAIAIKDRTNYRLQRQMSPKRFWKHMAEHNTISP